MIIYNIDNFTIQPNDNFIIGSFESFHMGHFQLLKNISSNSGRKIVICFNNEEFMPKFGKVFFTDNFAKYTTLASLGINAVIELNFSKISLMDGKDFLNKIFSNHQVNITVGKDFRFGRGAKYTAQDIEHILPNAKVNVLDLYKVQNVKISTKDLKDLLEFGDIDKLNLLLPKNYSFSGFFTGSNIVQTHEKIAPIHPGIYIVLIKSPIVVYYGVLHQSLDQNKYLHLIDSEIKFPQKQQLLVEVIAKLKIITSKPQDLVTEQDLCDAKSYFIENKNMI
ncbi:MULTISPECIES: FAD synthase [unclassified Mycoplasma]|uniref:FAD synthase n=1 Tax=unclassified Mycoplasma TaxID=2683645 RepID=UPI00211B843E|nr:MULTISPECIES: hypothetical protein [unclassified Mycoplasma]UUM19693.1 hypothetical protein NPA11_02900 [Mycoplasma sp. 1578d]UUM24676.1 hypothetical protein NPA12_03195 [Mycoplasma sp. 3686d]